MLERTLEVTECPATDDDTSSSNYTATFIVDNLSPSKKGKRESIGITVQVNTWLKISLTSKFHWSKFRKYCPLRTGNSWTEVAPLRPTCRPNFTKPTARSIATGVLQSTQSSTSAPLTHRAASSKSSRKTFDNSNSPLNSHPTAKSTAKERNFCVVVNPLDLPPTFRHCETRISSHSRRKKPVRSSKHS